MVRMCEHELPNNGTLRDPGAMDEKKYRDVADRGPSLVGDISAPLDPARSWAEPCLFLTQAVQLLAPNSTV